MSNSQQLKKGLSVRDLITTGILAALYMVCAMIGEAIFGFFPAVSYTHLSGYDYTLYGPDNKTLDGGQLDAPGLTLPDAGQEALNLLGQTAAVSEVLLGDKLAAFQEAAEKANEIPAPIKIPDPTAEPTVTILWSESDKLQDGEIMPLSVANRVFEELDTTQHTEREKDGYTGGWYDKTAFRIDFTLNGQPDNYEGRQDFGDGEGSLVQHIQNYHEYYAKDENWKNFVLHNKGPKAWEQDKAEREMVLTEFIPYLKQHCNLSAMEQTATAALREGQNISPEQTVYYNAVVTYVQDCRPLLNQGQYNLPEPPKLADFDQSLQDYKAQVQAEIAQEAAATGMTVEEYAAAGFEAPQQDSFSIYQLRNDDSTRDSRFEPYDLSLIHISAVIGATEKRNGYWQGGGYLVSWCIGHLVSFAEVGQYDEKYCKWRYDDLPIQPQSWQFIVPDEKKQQFEIVRALLNRPDVDSVTAATDAGREG